MRSKMVQDVIDFHEKYGLAYAGKPRLLPMAMAEFRVKFMQEELDEYGDSVADAHALMHRPATLEHTARIRVELEKQLDALVDEVYVVLGTAYQQGMADIWDKAWDRVQAANMAKVRASDASESKRGSSLDVIKPPGWTAPSHADLLEEIEI